MPRDQVEPQFQQSQPTQTSQPTQGQLRYNKGGRQEFKKYNRNYDTRERYSNQPRSNRSDARPEHRSNEATLSALELETVESFAKELQKVSGKSMNEVFQVPTSGFSWATMTEEDESRRSVETRDIDQSRTCDESTPEVTQEVHQD